MRLKCFASVLITFAMAVLFSTATQAEPVFIDLKPVANTSLQDDGQANNQKGGWSDEGANDMLVYPQIEFGKVKRNGHWFELIKPNQPLHPTLLMLKGQNRGQDKPQSATVAVPAVKAKYLYILMNAVGSVKGQTANHTAATCRVEYTDGTTAAIDLRDGIELRQWYTPQWWDNSGGSAWPFFMGQNLYSIKWRQYVGVWAMQWPNPTPDKPIKALTFESKGLAAPVIWAITLDNDDYRADPVELKKEFVRPPGIPEGFYDARLEQERESQYQSARAFELIQGVRSVAVLNDNLIAVTVDGGLGRIGAGEMRAKISKFSVPETFVIQSDQDATYSTAAKPAQVVRHSYETFQGNIPGFPGVTLYWHTFYLKLAAPMKPASTYSVTVKGMDQGLEEKAAFTFDDSKLVTPAIKVNQVAYSSASRQRYAYLGWWAAELGPVDYQAYKRFEVIDESNNRKVLSGEIALRKQADPYSGEDVYEMDLSALPVGRFHIRVPGLGSSDTFAVGTDAMRELCYHTLRAFYHQRAGVALTKPYTTYERPATFTEVYESGYTVQSDYVAKPGEPTRSFAGGYHDAGDDDVFTYHLRATSQVLDAYERYQSKLKTLALNIPESSNKLPDVLDEADWALRCYMQMQEQGGAVPMGRGNDQDLIRNKYRGKTRPAFGVLPPTNASSTEYAAVAAKYARLVEPYDPGRASDYLASADKALMWAITSPVDPEKNTDDRPAYLFQAWAAAELFHATGEQKYNEIFLKLYKAGHTQKFHWSLSQWTPLVTWPYLTTAQPGADREIQSVLRKRLLEGADWTVKRTNENPYRMGTTGKGLGWGTGNGGGHYGMILLYAYWLTSDQKYLDAASLNADFLLGANPISRTFITSVGARCPRQAQLSETLYTKTQKRGDAVPGITNYGLFDGPVPGWPIVIPPWRRVRDIGGGAEISSEFTITETIGASGMLFESLWGLEQ